MPSMFRAAVILGLLSAVGPFAVDMYLPALPEISRDLGVSVAATQATLTVYFLAFGVAQLIYGPWSDQVGRKLPLYTGLSLFVAASIGCALATGITGLTVFRFFQGLGASVVMVIPRAIIRDKMTGTEATRLMALVMLVISVSPMLAPLAGSAVLAVGDWRGIFWVLVVAASAGLFLTATLQPETLAKEHRVRVNVRSLWTSAGILLRDRVFLSMTLIGGFGMASFFVFVASAPFVYTGQFGLSPTQFSLAFAANAIGFFGFSQLAAPLGERFGALRVIRAGVLGFAVASSALLTIFAFGLGSLAVLVIGLLMANACLGLVLPTTMVLALDPHGEIAGVASSLGGTLQMVTGGVMIAVAGPFFDGNATPMLAAIAICAVFALMVSARMVRGGDAVQS